MISARKGCSLFAVILGLSQGTSLWAAPAINGVSGTFSKGQTITVSGSGFGNKSPAAPLVFDDFEGGSSGAQVQNKNAVAGRWGSGSWSGAVTYATTQPLEGSKVARHAFSGGTYNASLYVDPSSTQTVYLDFWMRVVPRDNRSRNFKSWRFYDSSDNERGNDVYYCSSAGGAGLDPPWVYKSRNYVSGQWMHYEVVAQYGSNGKFIQYRDGIADANVSGFNNGARVSQVRIGHYWGMDSEGSCPSNSGADIFTDLVYVDTSHARVVLGDAPSFSSSRKRAIQLPTSWGNNEVQFKLFPAQFKSGEVAYVFVIDPNNQPSPGYAVVIGEGVALPSAPTALTVD